MFTKIFVIAVVVLAISGENVMVDIARPRSSASGAFEESIRKFWTEDKLKAAESLDVVLPNRLSKTVSKPTNTSTGPEIRIPGSLPSNNNTLLRIISSRGRQVYTTGRVFWRVGTASYTCSAAVVSSKTSDLIVTAGHCVYDTTARTWFINNNWVFVPAYSNGNAPYGVWTARRMLTSNAWVNSADFNYDIAFVAVSMYQQRHLQTVVGSQGIAFNQPRLAFTYSFGYPSNLDSGLYLKSCSGNTQKSRYTQGNYVGQGLPCNMGKGCSGGPWLQYVVDSTGIGYVTSVNSFMINNVPNVMNGPYFDSNIQTIYNQATSM